MATASVKLSLDNAEFMARMAQAQARLAEFGASLRGIALTAAGAVAGLAGIYGVTQGLSKAIEEASNWEKLETSFDTLIGNTKVARETLADLQQFANTTPFEMNQVAPAAKQLLAYGFAAKDIVPTLRMLGDVASGLDVPLGELVEVFGKNVAQGRMFQQDIMQFQGRGIPIVAELAKQFGVSEQAVRGLVEQGKVGSKEVILAFQSMTGAGSKFGGMMDAQSKTFAGMMSNLKDAFDGAFREFGKPLIDALKPVLAWVASNMEGLKAKAAEWGAALAKGIRIAFEAFKEGKIGELVELSLKLAFLRSMVVLENMMKGILAGFAAGWNAFMNGTSSGDGGLKYLGDLDWWSGVIQIALSQFAKIGVFLLSVATTFVSFISAGLIKAAEALTELLPGKHEKARDFGDIFKAQQELFAPGLASFTEGYRETERDGINARRRALKRNGESDANIVGTALRAFVSEIGKASDDPETNKRIGDTATALKNLVEGLNAAGQRAEDAFKPDDKTGAPNAGKNFLADPDATASGKKFSVIASSLAKVGGGGLFAAALPTDPLIAATKNATQATDRNTAAVIENNRLLSQPKSGERFSLTHR